MWLLLFLLKQTCCICRFIKYRHVKKNAFQHRKYDNNVCWFNEHTQAMNLKEYLGSGHPQNAP